MSESPCASKSSCAPAPCDWKFNPCDPKGYTDGRKIGAYVNVDVLYWRAENHGFSYAYELQTTVPAGLNMGHIVRVDPDWDPAFRIGVGRNMKNDFFDVLLNYTWYRNKSSETNTSSNGFFPLWPVSSVAIGSVPFNTVTASAHFTLNILDLEFGRWVDLTRSLAIRPHAGLEGGSVHQKFKDLFSGRLAGSNSQERFYGRNNYWGVGPRTGVSGEWQFKEGFSLLGKMAGALLYGKTQARSLNENMATGESLFTTNRQYKDNFYQLVPHLQMALGLQWQSKFSCDNIFCKMALSWETNFWWNQCNMPYSLGDFVAPIPTVGNQPLTMEGLTANFELNF